MIKHRMPVVGAGLHLPVKCADPDTGRVFDADCQAFRDALPKGKKKTSCPRGCRKGAWLYPRYRRNGIKPAGDTTIHFHQGIDIGGEMPGVHDGVVPIVSVTAGKVHYRNDEDNGESYGRTIVIVDDAGVFYLYAHCHSLTRGLEKNVKVVEQQVLGFVGSSGSAEKEHPHLHFEVSLQELPMGRGGANETQPGEVPTHRFDPRKALEALGPWGMTQAAFPDNKKVDPKTADDLHYLVHTSPAGGFFPLGANNVWHGGVHVEMPEGSTVYAPVDGTIVAARLDADPTRHRGAYGSANFVLIKHTITNAVLEMMRQGATDPAQAPKTKPPAPAPRGVGKGMSNDGALVLEAKQRLHALGLYKPEPAALLQDPTIDSTTDDGKTDPFLAALGAFQELQDNPSGNPHKLWPDFAAGYDNYTWKKLVEQTPQIGKPTPDAPDPAKPDAPVAPPEDPTSVVYCLLMHLGARALDDTAAHDVPWLARAAVPLTDAEKKRLADEEPDRAQEHERDLQEAASHDLTKTVGAGDENPKDVQWVQRRLQTFGLYSFAPGEPSGVVDETLTAAIVAFQQKYVYNNPAKADGIVTVSKPKKGTHESLLLSNAALSRTRGKGPRVAPGVAAAFGERDATGTANVVVGLDPKVHAGEAVWISDRAGAFSDTAGTTLPQVHFEIFSEHPIFEQWEQIVDDDDDLTADAPAKLMEAVEVLDIKHSDFQRDGIISVSEIMKFYQDAKSLVLRKTRCKFRSEWGLDVDAAMDRLSKRGWNTTGLADSLAKYQWWDAAADVLPADPKVWHYNPVEFLAQYQAILDGFAAPELKDANLFTTVAVIVYNKHGGLVAGQPVRVAARDGSFDETKLTTQVSRSGTVGGQAIFYNVPVVAVDVTLPKIASINILYVAVPHAINEIEVATPLEGKMPPTGTISVRVRRHTGAITKAPVELSVQRHGKALATTTSSKSGKAEFSALAMGSYTIVSADPAQTATPVVMTLDKPKATVMLKLDVPDGELVVRVTRDGAPVAGSAVAVFPSKRGAAEVKLSPSRTDASGVLRAKLPEGGYKVFSEDGKSRRVGLKGHQEAVLEFELAHEMAGDDPVGQLQVRVLGEEEAQAGVEVCVVDDGEFMIDAAKTDDNGVAEFELPPASYSVVLDGVATPAAVEAGTTTEVTVTMP